jgi:hypothetical protein
MKSGNELVCIFGDLGWPPRFARENSNAITHGPRPRCYRRRLVRRRSSGSAWIRSRVRIPRQRIPFSGAEFHSSAGKPVRYISSVSLLQLLRPAVRAVLFVPDLHLLLPVLLPSILIRRRNVEWWSVPHLWIQALLVAFSDRKWRNRSDPRSPPFMFCPARMRVRSRDFCLPIAVGRTQTKSLCKCTDLQRIWPPCTAQRIIAAGEEFGT